MKGAKNKTKNKNVVGNDSAMADASIEEIEKNVAAAAGLVEGPEADDGTAGEESRLPAVPSPAAAPAAGEDEPDPLTALLAAQGVPATATDDVQQPAGEQAVPQDGAGVAAPVRTGGLTEQEQIDLRNGAMAADAARHAAEAERAKQSEEQDRMDYDQAAYYEAGGQQRTGPGVGCGLFDSDLTGTDLRADRWGRNYRDVDPQGQKRWTLDIENMWEQDLANSRKAAQEQGGTYRLFKARWQGQELSRDSVVKALAKTLVPIGDVDVQAALKSEMFDSMGLASNKQEEMEGAGGGCYVPIRMRDITRDWTPEQETAIKELWGGALPVGSEDHGPGNGARYWDCPAEYFTIGVNTLMADRQEVVHNLCVQLTWWTLESTRLPEPMGYLSGDWYVKELKVAKREELLMLRLMQAAGNGVRLMLKPSKVQGMRMQEICGLADRELKVEAMIKKLVHGYSIEWAGGTRLVVTSKADQLQRQKLRRSAQSLADHRKERLTTDVRKMVLKPLSKTCKGEEQANKVLAMLAGVGLEGIQSVSFSPDKYPDNPRSGVVGFVVFAEQAQRDAAITGDRASMALRSSEFQLGTRIIRCEQKDPDRNLALDRLEQDTVAQATGKETAQQQADRRKALRQGAWQGGGMTITDERGTVLQRGGGAALQQMQGQANSDLTAALAVRVNQLFASFNQKFEASRREETRKADEAIRLMQEENAALRRQMLDMEAARQEQDRKMGIVLEGIMARLGAGPLPLAEVMTPPRSGAGQYAPQAIQAGGAPQQVREAPATNSRPAARQTVAVPVPEAETGRGRAMEAALRGMMGTGGEEMLQLLRNSGHEGVASMLTMEGTGLSTQQ